MKKVQKAFTFESEATQREKEMAEFFEKHLKGKIALTYRENGGKRYLALAIK